jgi:hypothetical protein
MNGNELQNPLLRQKTGGGFVASLFGRLSKHIGDLIRDQVSLDAKLQAANKASDIENE